MASLTPTIPVKDPELGRGGSGAHPPLADGGGDDERDNGSPDYGGRLRRTRLGLLIGLAAIIMLFVGLTSAYVVRRGLPSLNEGSTTYVRDWIPVDLPTGLLLVNTLLLVLSSVTAELARRQVARQAALAPVQSIPGVSLGTERVFPWLAITVILGLGFLVGQWMAWQVLADRGFYLASNPSSSFVYLLTAAHAVHLVGGIIALSYAGINSLLKRPVEARRIVIDIAVWYWHFMAFLWLYIFGLLEFMR